MVHVKKVTYNWFYTTTDGESFLTVEVGKSLFPSHPIVTGIYEHKPQGEGDSLYYTVHYDDFSERKIMNPNEVFYESDSN